MDASATVAAYALSKSAFVNGCFSVETKCSRSQRAGSARHAAQVIRKLIPMPKPVSSTVKMRLPCHRAGQAIALQEDVLRLGETAHGAVIDVVVTWRKRRAVVAKSEGGGDQRIGHAGQKIDGRTGQACGPGRTGHRARAAGRLKRRLERWQKPTPSLM